MDKCENAKDFASLSSSTRKMLKGFDSVKLSEIASILADNALNNFEYQGKSLRDWAGLVSSGKLVEVVHGQWIHIPSSDMMTGKAYKCSECGKMRYGSYMPNYCQCCGAKMDGGGSNGI